MLLCVFSLTSIAAPSGKTVVLSNGVVMPSINLGTCCGSEPSVGLPPWLAAGGIGIDTAYDYHDQRDIARIINGPSAPPRSSIFITTKIPAGFGNATDCDADPDIPVRYIRENLKELNTDYADLALIHSPCHFVKDPVAANNALWRGMQQALALNLTRAIGVSNYGLQSLLKLDTSGGVPAVNQCDMSVSKHDDETIAYCQAHGIVYESYFTLKGCPWDNAQAQAIAAAHDVSMTQLCLRYILERGAIIAAGTGSNASTVGPYAKENLDIYNFELSTKDMDVLNKIGS
jgi:2,5-diketo-D-gluconate reductase A